MNVLVAGGAGYVGSHTAKVLAEQGHSVVIVDNLVHGHRQVADILGVPLIVADLGDRSTLEKTLRQHAIECVMHFAAYAYVEESTRDPLRYYENNVATTLTVLEAMAKVGVEKLVFSSTCAVYGHPKAVPIREDTPKVPVSPYGRSKLMVEQILADHLIARPNFSYAALRYFNASGAAMDGTLGEHHDPETHLIPLVVQSALNGRQLKVFGADYPTPDGTAVRDYIHVDDLGQAHSLAMRRLSPGFSFACNLGTGRGFSVKEIIDATARVSGVSLSPEIVGRRAGDPPMLYADVAFASQMLGWKARHTEPVEIIQSAWDWARQNPNGYR